MQSFGIIWEGLFPSPTLDPFDPLDLRSYMAVHRFPWPSITFYTAILNVSAFAEPIFINTWVDTSGRIS